MPISATKRQVTRLLNIGPDTVTNLIHQGRLRRLPGNRWVHITLESICEYSGVNLELVIQELHRIEANPIDGEKSSGNKPEDDQPPGDDEESDDRRAA